MVKRTQAPDWTSTFQDAALDPGQWLPALEQLADATGSSRAELVGFGSGTFVPFNWITYSDRQMVEDFHSSGGALPTLNYRLAADDGASLLTIVDERDYDRQRKQVQRSDYLDFCEKHAIVFGCQTTLHRQQGGLIGMSVLRSRADGRTDERARRTFGEAARAASVAVRMQRAIEHQGVHILNNALGAMSLPCLLLDGFGEVQSCTSAADELLRNEPLLTVSDGRLSSTDARAQRAIDLAVRSILAPQHHSYASVPLGRSPARRLRLDMFRLPNRDWTMHFAPRVIVVIRDPSGQLRRHAEMLAATFGLTPAETEVALSLCEGVPRKKIAVDREVSLETLRTQIRSLYSKTGCGRESELVVMLRAMLG
jgi:DNA-binding CsgD family transcriptional regulator